MARYDDDDDLDERPRRNREREDDDRDYAKPRKKSNLGLILGIVAGLLFLVCGGVGLLFLVGGVGMFNATRSVRDAADRAKASNDSKQIAIGIQNYADGNRAFPTNSYSPDGKPLLSWRVHILPYIEQPQAFNDVFHAHLHVFASS